MVAVELILAARRLMVTKRMLEFNPCQTDVPLDLDELLKHAALGDWRRTMHLHLQSNGPNSRRAA